MVKNPDHRFATMEQLGRSIKASFSPRSGGARQAAAQVPVAGGGAPEPEPEADLSDLGGEEELDVTGAGPATVPLPKKKISLRTWIIVGAAAVLLVVAGLIVLLVVHRSQFDRLQAAAEAAPADGLKADKDSPPRRPDAEEARGELPGSTGAMRRGPASTRP